VACVACRTRACAPRMQSLKSLTKGTETGCVSSGGLAISVVGKSTSRPSMARFFIR